MVCMLRAQWATRLGALATFFRFLYPFVAVAGGAGRGGRVFTFTVLASTVPQYLIISYFAFGIGVSVFS